MATIDRHGALHDNQGRYAEHGQVTAGYDLTAPSQAPYVPTFGDPEYDRQLGEVVATALTPLTPMPPGLSRVRRDDEDDDTYTARMAQRERATAVRDREQDEKQAAEQVLTEQFGSVEQAVVHLGESVANRAETYAGVDAEQVRQSWRARHDAAETEYERRKEAWEAIEKSAGWPEFDAATQRYLAAQEAAQNRHRVEELRHAQYKAGRAHGVGSPQWVAAQEDYEAADDAWRNDSELTTAREAREAARARMRELQEPTRDALTEAISHLNQIKAGLDEQTKNDLRALADGYERAVSDVRDLGGSIELHPKSQKAALTAFGEGMRVFPTDWVAASNKAATVGHAPIAKVTKSRAHYTDYRVHTTRQRVHESGIWTGGYTAESYGLTIGENTSTLHAEWEWVPAGDPDRQERHYSDDAPMWRRKEYEVNHSAWHDADDPNSAPPRGRGWERYKDAERGFTYWRRPKYTMKDVESVGAPEITTNTDQVRVAGVSATFSTSIHEASHRFESTVPGIKKIEAEFVERRATDTDGTLAPLKPIYGGRGKIGKEVHREAGFVNKYSSKEYTSGHREVLSTGMESIFAGENGALIGIGGRPTDLEHRAFVLGTLAGVGKRGLRRRYQR